jgi:hypothetical protein
MRLALDIDRASIRANGRDPAFIAVEVVDTQGVIAPDASNMIDFAIVSLQVFRPQASRRPIRP